MAEAPRVLSDRYEVRSTLGRGGMAQVYRATDRVLGRTVAVKVLSRRFSEDRRFVARFRREAQASAGLNHPHVVSVFDTGSHDGVHYIVMEYVEGETLGAILAREGPLPLDRAARIAADVAEALESAHRQGLVHRDVKPGNVMIDRQGRVKVVDFGIARAAADDTLTQTGTVLGTASYLSPEQARGDRVDARSDVYSLGCVLYEMVTGRTPFAADSSVAMAFRHVNEEPRPPSELRPEVPAELDAVVMRALEKEPDHRFRSAAEMRGALLSA
ncbi:MAG TPA: protein kinase, partial [Actinomycetota bacterium]|nr:protein kinase [Actinomycetota bacterium]